MPRPPEAILALVVALVPAGCTTQWADHTDSGGGAMRPTFDNASATSAAQNQELADYVRYMDVLVATDEAGWNGVFAHASQAAASDPTPENRLRLALVLTQPDRPAEDLQAARDLLVALLESERGLSPAVRKVARVKLVETERRIALHQTIESLRSQLARAKNEVLNEKQERKRVERERALAEQEIERIRSALADALAKLEAITNIERSVERSQNEAPIP